MVFIHQYLTEDATKTLASSCILSRLDYCNSLLAGYPQTLIKPLQQVQNSAAKLILKSRRTEHCKPLLKQLHWLPIEQRIKYESSCLCYQIITGTAPQYLAEQVRIYIPSRSLRSSSDDRTFRTPHLQQKTAWWTAPSVSLLHIHGILSLTSSAIALLSLPSRLI